MSEKKDDFGSPKRKEQVSPPVKRQKQKGLKHNNINREREGEQRSPGHERTFGTGNIQRLRVTYNGIPVSEMPDRQPGTIDHNASCSSRLGVGVNHSHIQRLRVTYNGIPVPEMPERPPGTIDHNSSCASRIGAGVHHSRTATPVPLSDSEFMASSQDGFWGEINSYLDNPDYPNKNPDFVTETTQKNLTTPIISRRPNIIENPMNIPPVEREYHTAWLSNSPMPNTSSSPFQQSFNFQRPNPFLNFVETKPIEETLKPGPSMNEGSGIFPNGHLFGETAEGFDTSIWARNFEGSDIERSRLFRPFRRSRANDQNIETDIRSYFTRENNLFDVEYQNASQSDRGDKRVSTVRERLRQLERRNVFEEAREQAFQERRRRTRQTPNPRERNNTIRGEFGALMNALGLLTDDDILAGRENSSISRMRDAVFGVVNSRLPPHLLFSDRDFDADDYDYLCSLDETIENRKGADDSIINKISLVSFNKKRPPTTEQRSCRDADTDLRCPICLEEFKMGVDMRIMPCRHEFHKCCLDKWLKIKAVCPICSMNIKDKFNQEK